MYYRLAYLWCDNLLCVGDLYPCKEYYIPISCENFISLPIIVLKRTQTFEMCFAESFEYELRAYISKGRGLMAGDDSGLSGNMSV